MKTETFQMRISKETKMKLDQLAKYYNLSASSVIDMLIFKEAREHLQDMETDNTHTKGEDD